jgi:hypothetical protein
MKAIVTGDLLILVPDTADEKAALARWKNGRNGDALATVHTSGAGTSIQFIRPREEGPADQPVPEGAQSGERGA